MKVGVLIHAVAEGFAADLPGGGTRHVTDSCRIRGRTRLTAGPLLDSCPRLPTGSTTDR